MPIVGNYIIQGILFILCHIIRTMNTSGMETFDDSKFVLHRIKFSILLLLEILATTLSIVIFIFFYKHRAVLRAPQNHSLLLLLVVNFIQLVGGVPLTLHFYRLGYVSPPTPIYCTWWTFFEYTIYAISEFLLATISVQRHIFIFSAHLLRIRWMRYVFHHLPLLLCLLYPTLFYVFAIILYPCDGTQWDFTNNLCGYANCYLLFDPTLGTFDLMFDNIVPIIIDVLSNVFLIVRVARIKRRRQQQSRWRQQRRMMLQLFCLSSLYVISWLPLITVYQVQIFYPNFLAEVQSDYFLDLVYVSELFLPWICIGFLPELIKWIKQLCCRRRAPNVVGITNSRNVVGTVQTRNVVRTPQLPQLETAI